MQFLIGHMIRKTQIVADLMAHVCNARDLGKWEDHSSKPAQGKKLVRSHFSQ
jgi:hypothetical protein